MPHCPPSFQSQALSYHSYTLSILVHAHPSTQNTSLLQAQMTGLWWVPSPRPRHTTCPLNLLPMSKFHLLPQIFPNFSNSTLFQPSSKCQLPSLKIHRTAPHLAIQFRPAHSRTSIPDCLWPQLVPMEAPQESILKEEVLLERKDVISLIHLFLPVSLLGAVLLRNPEANTAGL